jgi:hypothetical protein
MTGRFGQRVVATLVAAALAGTAVVPPAVAQTAPAAPLVSWPNADYDPAIPTLQTVAGFEIGAEMARHAEVRRYFEALASAAPDRMKLFDYGRSWEGRGLFYGVIGSPANIARLDEIKAGMQKLADPRRLVPGEAERLIASLPAAVWLTYSVHGNEPGTTDAALKVAYHLLASRGDARVPQMMRETVVVVVPLQNPDGRERFINSNRAARGLMPDGSPLSAERDEPWPGGRMNHYVFDMNRDWFAQTQPEMRAQAARMLEWMPVVVADVHEMGTNQTYFFPPEADPMNPNLTRQQLANTELLGRNNAAWFDRFGLRYFTREIFDGFYPGYGSGWPNYQGASAMVYEQGSSRGLVARRSDGTTITFADTVMSQFIASLSAVEVVANNKAKFLRDFFTYRSSAIQEGRSEPVRSYIIPTQADQSGAAHLAATLVRNGIDVTRAGSSFEACGRSYNAGTYIVTAAQPAKRLLRTLMDDKTVMDPAFVKRQADRVARGLPDEIYDVTAWSLPLMFNVRTDTCGSVPGVSGEAVTVDHALAGGLTLPESTIGWVVPWGSVASVRFLTSALRAGLDVRSSDKPFTVDGRRYVAGSLLVLTSTNARDGLADRVRALAQGAGVTAVGMSESWVTDGPNLGSPTVVDMRLPRIALAWDDPTERYSAGHTRFVIERQFGHPVTLVRARRLAAANLNEFDVLLIPGEAGSYSRLLGKAGIDNIKGWVRRGGVLVSIGTGTRFLAEPDVDLLGLRLEQAAKDGKDAGKDEKRDATVPGSLIASEADLAKAMEPKTASPLSVAGALARVTVDPDHWLSAGVAPTLNVLVTGSEIYAPVRRDDADTVARFTGPNDVLVSGVLWEPSRKQIAFKPFAVTQSLGRGVVVGFTQDPNFRAYLNGLNLIFANAIFRGAAQADPVYAEATAEEEQR